MSQLPVPTLEDAEADNIFSNACIAFQDSLSNEEKKSFAPFTDPTSMIESITKQCEDHPVHKAKLTRCCKKIHSVTKSLEPYFEIINSFVRADKYAGIVWGAIRLVFQLGSNYATFLEKLSQMFEQIAAALPVYGNYVDLIRERAKFIGHGQDQDRKNELFRASRLRLYKALGNVYADVIEFCQMACRIFCTGKGLQFRTTFIRDLGWKPFDVRFADILRRFGQHCTEFEREMAVDYKTDILILLSHFLSCEKDFNKAEDLRRQRDLKIDDSERAKLASQEKDLLKTRVKDLKQWVNAPDWQDKLDNICRRRADGTGEWIFSEPSYKEWILENQRSLQQGKYSKTPILLVQGKPGYGKTFLCANMICHLKDSQLPSDSCRSETMRQPDTVLFFFFDKLDSRGIDPLDCFRAILAQLMHAHRDDIDTIDTASVLMDTKGRGLLRASNDEILSLLAFVLRRFPGIILVIDGIDECRQQEEFFDCLLQVTTIPPNTTLDPTTVRVLDGQSDPSTCNRNGNGCCGVLLFGRPDIKLPSSIINESFSIDLTAHQNLHDIKCYVKPKILKLLQEELLAQDKTFKDYVKTISTHANGMFLWARLLMEFLHSDGLSIQDRMDALNNLVALEGLDALYGAVLLNIYQRHPERARKNIKKIFHWVAGTMRPLHISEVQAALHLSETNTFSNLETISNFRRSLSRMSGALLEITAEETVRFIHTSATDYLQRRKDSFEHKSFSYSDFHLLKGPTQRFIATSCVSYINNHIPAGPLGGAPQITADIGYQRDRYPLFEYCVQHWAQHACSGLGDSDPGTHYDQSWLPSWSYKDLIEQIVQFVRNRRLVTTWIEASFLFGDKPSLHSLPSVIANLGLSATAASCGRHVLKTLASDVERFSKDLDSLCKSWGYILKNTPNEIWEPSIPAFTKSDFWVDTEKAAVGSLSSDVGKLETAMLIYSQVSSDGTEVGLIKLIPPCRLTDTNWMLTPNLSPAGWQACYEIWSLETKTVTFTFSVDIPQIDMEALLYTEMKPYMERKLDYYRVPHLHFEFPVALSGDLRRIFLLKFLIIIQNKNQIGGIADTISGCTVSCSSLSFWPRQTDPGLLKMALCFYSLRVLFSPSGDYLLLLRPSLENVRRIHLEPIGLTLDIYEGSATCEYLVPAYSATLSGHSLPLEEYGFSKFYRHFTFHSFQPIIAFASMSATFIWTFSISGAEPIEIHEQPLKELKFSDCGNYIHGFAGPSYEQRLVVIDLRSSLNDPVLAAMIPSLNSNPESVMESKGKSRLTMQKLATGPPRPVQRAGEISFSQTNSGAAQMSVLRPFEEQGAVVLHSLREDGTVRSETLSRVPKDISLTGAVFVAPSLKNGSETIRLVLNKPPEKFFAFTLHSKSVYPLVIERMKDSIRAKTGKSRPLFGLLPPEENTDGNSHKRIKLDTE